MVENKVDITLNLLDVSSVFNTPAESDAGVDPSIAPSASPDLSAFKDVRVFYVKTAKIRQSKAGFLLLTEQADQLLADRDVIRLPQACLQVALLNADEGQPSDVIASETAPGDIWQTPDFQPLNESSPRMSTKTDASQVLNQTHEKDPLCFLYGKQSGIQQYQHLLQTEPPAGDYLSQALGLNSMVNLSKPVQNLLHSGCSPSAQEDVLSYLPGSPFREKQGAHSEGNILTALGIDKTQGTLMNAPTTGPAMTFAEQSPLDMAGEWLEEGAEMPTLTQPVIAPRVLSPNLNDIGDTWSADASILSQGVVARSPSHLFGRVRKWLFN
jgi:hypothetical protein